MTMRLRPAALGLLALALAACDSSEAPPPAAALFVGNQGNFSDNNGSLTRYDIATGQVRQDVVPDLGGLVQNLYGGGQVLYVLLNFDDSFTTGRGRIDVVNAASLQRTRQIDVRTPRSLALRATSSTSLEVLVTNLYDGTATAVDLLRGSTLGTVAVGPAPEGVVDSGPRGYVANSGFGEGRSITVVDLRDLTVVETLDDVCAGPRTLLVDAEGDVWAICTGTRDATTGRVTAPGEVVVLDGPTGRVLQRFTYPGETLGSATFGGDGVFVAGTGDVYVIAGAGVLRFDAPSNAFEARIAVAGAPIGAVEYDVTGDRLYLARPDAANPFTADGAVTIHDPSGAQVGRFPAGIAPSSFAFIAE